MQGDAHVVDGRERKSRGHDGRGGQRQANKRRGDRRPMGDGDRGRERRRWTKRQTQVQMREKINVPFVPPKPNEFESAARIRISRAASGT